MRGRSFILCSLTPEMYEAKAGAILGKCTPGVSIGCQAMAKVPRPGAVHGRRSFDRSTAVHSSNIPTSTRISKKIIRGTSPKKKKNLEKRCSRVPDNISFADSRRLSCAGSLLKWKKVSI